jgi:hypothetical protein
MKETSKEVSKRADDLLGRFKGLTVVVMGSTGFIGLARRHSTDGVIHRAGQLELEFAAQIALRAVSPGVVSAPHAGPQLGLTIEGVLGSRSGLVGSLQVPEFFPCYRVDSLTNPDDRYMLADLYRAILKGACDHADRDHADIQRVLGDEG